MIIKEKRWLSRLVAMLCVLTMVVGVLTPASVGVAATANVKKIIANIPEGVTFIDERGEDMSELIVEEYADEEHYYESASYRYRYKYDYSQNLEIVPIKDSSFTEICFYAKAELKPSITTKTAGVNIYIESTTSVEDVRKGNWRITISFTRAAKEEVVSLEVAAGTPKYTVSIPEGDDYYVELLGDTKFDTNSRNITAAEGEEIDFNVTVEPNKEVSVTAYLGETVPTRQLGDDSPSEPNTYGYRLTVKNRNTTVKISVSDKTYTVTEPDTNDAYLYIPDNNSTKVVPGGHFSFYVYPQDGFDAPVVKVASKKDDGEFDEENASTLPGYNNRYLISNINKDTKIIIQPGNAKKYNVSFDEGIGYVFNSIIVDTEQKNNAGTYPIEHGKNVKFKIVPSNGYRIIRVNANNEILTANQKDTYTKEIKEDTVITVVVQKISYTIKYPENTEENYSVVPDVTSAGYGDFVTFNVIPKPGNKTPELTAKYSNISIDDAEENGNDVTVMNLGGTQYKVEIKGYTVITAQDAGKEIYTIEYNSGEGYEFYSSASTAIPHSSVSYGEDVTFKLHVDKHYSDSTPIVLANGKTIPTVSNDGDLDDGKDYTCKITNVTENQIVSVTGIEKNTYTVTLEDGDGYTLDTTQSTSVAAGTKFSFKWNVSAGYTKPNGIDIAGSNHTDLNSHNESYGLTGNCSFTVTGDTTVKLIGVKKDKYKIEIEKGNATITKVGSADSDNIEYGGSYNFIVNANKYYQVTDVLLNGISLEPSRNGVYTVSNIYDNSNKIEIATRKNKLTVNYSGAKYGKAVADEEDTEGSIEITHDDSEVDDSKVLNDLTDSIPEKCIYKFIGWTWDGNNKAEKSKSVGIADLETLIEKADTEINITALWEINKDAIEGGIYVTTGAESKVSSDKYKLTFKCIVNLVADMIGSEHENDVKITGYGIIYGADPIDNLNETDIERIKKRQTDITENGMYKDTINDKRIFNYFMNVELTINDISNGNFFYITSEVNNKSSKRYGLAWMELTVGDDKIIISGSQESLPSADNAVIK